LSYAHRVINTPGLATIVKVKVFKPLTLGLPYDLSIPVTMILPDDCSSLNRTGKKFEAFGSVIHFIQQGYLLEIDQIGNFFVGMKPLDVDPIKIDYEQIKKLQAKMAVFAGPRRFGFL
jgi:hypothetical protein